MMFGCRSCCDTCSRCSYCECSSVVGAVNVFAFVTDVVVLGVVSNVRCVYYGCVVFEGVVDVAGVVVTVSCACCDH